MVTSGKIKDESGIKDVLQMVLGRKGVSRSILRILSKEVSGRLAIKDSTYIAGAQVTASGTSGHAAIRALLSVQKGLFAYFEPDNTIEYDELNEGLRVPIQQLVETQPALDFERLAAAYDFEFRQPAEKPAVTPEALLTKFMASARISWQEIVRNTFSGLPAAENAGDSPAWRLQAQRSLSGLTALVAPRQSLKKVPRITLSAKKPAQAPDAAPPACAVAAEAATAFVERSAEGLAGTKFGRRASDRAGNRAAPGAGATPIVAVGATPAHTGATPIVAVGATPALLSSEMAALLQAVQAPVGQPEIGAGFLVQPDIPAAVSRRLAIEHAAAQAAAAEPAGMLRRTVQKIKSRVLAEKEAMSKTTQRMSQWQRLKSLTEHDTNRPRGLLSFDRATIMGIVVTFAIVVGVCVCKFLSDLSSPEEQVRTGQKCLAIGDYDLAIADFSIVLRKQPDNIQALSLRAAALIKDRQPQKALDDYNRVIAIAGSHAPPACLFERAQLLFDLGKLSDAQAACDALLAVQPADADTLALKGMVHARSGKYEQALGELSNVPPDMKAEAAIHKGYALWKLDRMQQSVAEYKRAALAFPENAIVFYEKGLAERQAGNSDDGAADIKKAAQLDPANAKILLALNRLHGNPADNSQPQPSADGKTLLALGLQNYDDGKFAQCAVHLKEAAQKGACDARARAILARAFKNSGDGKAAYQQFLALALVGELQPGDRVSFAECAADDSMYDDCIEVLSHDLRNHPHSLETRLALITAYKKSGHKQLAGALAEDGIKECVSSQERYLLKNALD